MEDGAQPLSFLQQISSFLVEILLTPTNSVNYRRGIFSPTARVGMPPTTRGTNST